MARSVGLRDHLLVGRELRVDELHREALPRDAEERVGSALGDDDVRGSPSLALGARLVREPAELCDGLERDEHRRGGLRCR